MLLFCCNRRFKVIWQPQNFTVRLNFASCFFSTLRYCCKERLSSKGNIFSMMVILVQMWVFKLVSIFLFYPRELAVFRVILPLPLLFIHNVFQVFIFLVEAVISNFFCSLLYKVVHSVWLIRKLPLFSLFTRKVLLNWAILQWDTRPCVLTPGAPINQFCTELEPFFFPWLAVLAQKNAHCDCRSPAPLFMCTCRK